MMDYRQAREEEEFYCPYYDRVQTRRGCPTEAHRCRRTVAGLLTLLPASILEPTKSASGRKHSATSTQAGRNEIDVYKV